MRKVTFVSALFFIATAAVACSAPTVPDAPSPSGSNDSRSRGGPSRAAAPAAATKDQLEEAQSQAAKVSVSEDDYSKFEREAKAAYANAPPPSDGDGVPIAKRAVVVVNDSTTEGPDPTTYRLIDKGMKLLFDLGLRGSYGKVIYLGEGEATWSAFVNGVASLAKDPTVAVVDAFINLHGGPGELGFNGVHITNEQVTADLVKAVPDDLFYKLRIVYNQACFGESQSAGFIGGGFLTVAGTRGVHTSGFVDWPTFVSTWGGGGSFEQSLQRSTGATLGELASRWFGGGESDIDNSWIIDGEAEVSLGTPLMPATAGK